jgi:hypothetical protein
MRRVLTALVIAALFLLTLFPVAGAQSKISGQETKTLAAYSQEIKIMPLGDSITFGSPDPSYFPA